MIDTINGKEQILQNYNARPLYRMWETELDGINFDNDMFETDRRIVIITYAKFGVLLDRDPDFHKHFDYIICDELQGGDRHGSDQRFLRGSSSGRHRGCPPLYQPRQPQAGKQPGAAPKAADDKRRQNT